MTGGIADANLNMPNPEARRQLFGALLAYASGNPVVVLDEGEQALHGEDTLKAIIDTKAPLKAAVLHGIPRRDFEASDWPEVLEAARLNFMQGSKLSSSYLAWLKEKSAA